MDSKGSSTHLVSQFVQVANKAAASVERVKRSPVALDQSLRRVTRGAGRVILAEPDDVPPELLAPFKEAPGVITNPTDAELASSHVGITDSFADVARTGSVRVSITRKLSGAISVFLPLHVCILEAEKIVARPMDVFTSPHLGSKALSRDFVFVTGPSATADMGPLVRGVHGPRRLHIIILG